MISVIIPTLNEEKYIRRTLDVFSRMKTPHEVIVSDGGSKDTTVEIARSAGAKVFVHDFSYKTNIADGRNQGEKMATGDILMFMDADCIILDPDDFFLRIQNYFDKNTKASAISPNLKVLPEYAQGVDRIVTSFMNFSFWFFTNVLRIPSAPGECQVMRKSAFDKVGGYNKALVVCEDIDMFNRLSKIGTVRCISTFEVWHTCRRAHQLGWAKLLSTWFINSIFFTFSGKVYSKEWKPIR